MLPLTDLGDAKDTPLVRTNLFYFHAVFGGKIVLIKRSLAGNPGSVTNLLRSRPFITQIFNTILFIYFQGNVQSLAVKLERKSKTSQSEHKDLVCKYCGITYKSRNGFKYHVMQHEGKFMFTCNVCNKGFFTKNNYDYHMNMHDGKGFCCLRCKKIFRSEITLRSHQTKCNK